MLYNFGHLVIAIGCLLFFSNFVFAFLHMQGFSNLDIGVPATKFCAIGGMALIFLGVAIRSMGRRPSTGTSMKEEKRI